MLIPIILSGGVGSRLWPLSRKSKPKHFMPLLEMDLTQNALNQNITNSDNLLSLLQQTVLRFRKDVAAGTNPFAINPVMVCDKSHRFLVADQCSELGIMPEDIIIEPERKDTAAAILLAVLYLSQKYPDAMVLVSPSDHYVHDLDYYRSRINETMIYAQQDNIVTFGIMPTYPETSYGYISADLNSILDKEVYKVQKFIEKPRISLAEQLLIEKNSFWNSGMFMFKISKFLEICLEFQPELFEQCKQTVASYYEDRGFIRFKDKRSFEQIKPISIDYAIMQDAKDMVVAKYQGVWADVGCWHGVWLHSNKEGNNNVVLGNVIYDDNVNNCYLRSDNRLLVVSDVNDLSIIETPDAVLVTSLNNSQNLRGIVENALIQGKKEFLEHSHVHKPWGQFILLEESSKEYKVKKLIIKPGSALSLQEHGHRDEHWVIVKGEAEIIKNNEILLLGVGSMIHIPAGTKHRITNKDKYNNLIIIEVQIGDYLGEDDIIRYQDNYGRVHENKRFE